MVLIKAEKKIKIIRQTNFKSKASSLKTSKASSPNFKGARLWFSPDLTAQEKSV